MKRARAPRAARGRATAAGGALVLLAVASTLAIADRAGGAGSSGAPARSAPVAAPGPRIGMNLAPVADYGTNLPFTDVFKSSRSWIEHGGPIAYDARGWPRLSPGQSVQSLMVRELEGRYPGGEYVVTWEGEGEVDLKSFDVISVLERSPRRLRVLVGPGNGGLLLEVKSSDPQAPVKNVRVRMPGFGPRSELLHPGFVELLRPFSVLRFMEWQRTNASPIVDWGDRPRPDDARYSTENGVPLEVMIDLANATGAEPWFTMPHAASDAFVRRFARLVRDRLAPGRRVWVEYSNEVWNGSFSQAVYCRERGAELGLSDDPFLAQLRYYAQRSVEVIEIWEEVFGGADRLVRVLGSQAANPWVSEKILEWKDAYRHADALAIAPYFGGTVGLPKNAAETATWTTKRLLDALEAEIDGENRLAIRRQAEVARRFGVELVAYEGGQHLVGTGGAENDVLLTDLFVSANRSPRMYDLYRKHLAHWAAEGGGLFVAFNDVGKPTKWGSWGAWEHREPVEDAPKARALLEAAARKAGGRRVPVR